MQQRISHTKYGLGLIFLTLCGFSADLINMSWGALAVAGKRLMMGVFVASLALTGPLGSEPASAAENVAVANSSDNRGYWTVDQSGVVTPKNGALGFGDLRGRRLNAPVVAMTPTPSNLGYWLVASDGGIFSFGDAQFFGSTGAMTLNQPVVGMSSTRDGSGYWMVAADGGIFSFGSAGFFGSTGAMRLNQPVVGMSTTTTSKGYWLVGADGGVFTFGDAKFFGSALGRSRAFGLAPTSDGGYAVLLSDGSIAVRNQSTLPLPLPVLKPPVSPPTSTPSTTTPVTTPPTVEPTPAVGGAGSNPFARKNLWVDPNNPARTQANAWQASRPGDAAVMARIGNMAAASWIGEWSGDTTSAVSSVVNSARSSSSMAVLVAYNIPKRDCGQWSAGGAAQEGDYRNWIDRFANGLGAAPTAVILEPDALAQLDCLDGGSKVSRLALLNYAVERLGSRPNTYVYIDAGHSSWHSSIEMAARLRAAGVNNARGFALNVSNFRSTSESTTYGNDISSRLGNKGFVVDTSRNGAGSNGEWCNPSGRALGDAPSARSNGNLDATLWIKRPGESDGSCNGGPSAGAWWADYALQLARKAGW